VAVDVHTNSTHPKIALEFEYEELGQQKVWYWWNLSSCNHQI